MEQLFRYVHRRALTKVEETNCKLCVSANSSVFVQETLSEAVCLGRCKRTLPIECHKKLFCGTAKKCLKPACASERDGKKSVLEHRQRHKIQSTEHQRKEHHL